jgi:two-component system NtrC family response regulator
MGRSAAIAQIPREVRDRSRGRVLIIDDEESMGRILAKSLGADGYHVAAYTDPTRALAAIPDDQPDVILTDVRMPGMTGPEVLERVRVEFPEIPIIIMTAYGTIEDAVDALRSGAYTYITKPFQHEKLLHDIERALRHRRLTQENERLSDPGLSLMDARRIIGSSVGLARVRDTISRAAKTESAVLITGESGVGKELVARAIHAQSARAGRRFVPVNCPAIPATLIESEIFGYERGAFTGADRPKMGLIELSAGGTLFLDEIGELPVELQVKLLRVLQEHEIQRLGGLRQIRVDLRVIAATNRSLQAEIEEGRFRQDLFYRINVIPIHVPPLRERPDDIVELTEFFLERIGRRLRRPGLRLADGVLHFFRRYAWPGNIRELENALERMAVLGDGERIDVDAIPADLVHGRGRRTIAIDAFGAEDAAESDRFQWPANFKKAREKFERSYLKGVIEESGGNITLAARLSGISRRSLYEKFEKLGLNKKSDREG